MSQDLKSVYGVYILQHTDLYDCLDEIKPFVGIFDIFGICHACIAPLHLFEIFQNERFFGIFGILLIFGYFGKFLKIFRTSLGLLYGHMHIDSSYKN